MNEPKGHDPKAMNRDELVEVAWQAWLGAGVGRVRDGVVAAVDAVEPIIRADEVERRFGWVTQEDARAWFLADLRAKVEGLPMHEFEEVSTYEGDRTLVVREGLRRRDVLDLFEEKP